MRNSILMGFVAGARAMTPLAAVSIAASRDALPENDLPVRLLGHPLALAGTVSLAAAELGGDKMKTAPDRIVLIGMIARGASAAISGAALAKKEDRALAALVATAVAVGAAYLTFNARIRAMAKYGQTPTGLIEDGLVIASAAAITR